jgi:hypothetical protein
MGGMEQELIRPDNEPKSSTQAFSSVGMLVAAAGATLLLLCLTGAAMVSTVWAFSRLFGFPDILMYVIMAAGAVPVLWVTAWTAGRAWHVEKLLATGRDVDQPNFKLSHYFRNG